MKAWQDGRLGTELGDDAAGKLWGGFKAAGGLGSAEIGSALKQAVAAGDAMPAAKGVTWVLTSQIEGYQALFRYSPGHRRRRRCSLQARLDAPLLPPAPAWL